MYILGIFIIELILLFFLSQSLTKTLSLWFYRIFRHQALVIQLLSLLFLPGVIIHELSHFFAASLLFVPTGEIEFLPEVHGQEVKMGSVSIASTDPFRRFIIGVAPLITGLLVMFLLFWYFLPSLTIFSWQTVLLGYAVCEISNTMFSSKKDMEGAIGLFVVMAVGIILLYVLRVNVGEYISLWLQIPVVATLFSSLSVYLGIALVIDVVLIGIAKGLLKVSSH